MNFHLSSLQKLTGVIFVTVLLVGVSGAYAQDLYWSGTVYSDGRDVGPINLQKGATYSIQVTGSFYMGIWYQNQRSIWNDACYEFNAHSQPTPITVLQNSLGINYCSEYNPYHIYQSAQFVSDGRPLWFRIHDTDYRDNEGGLNVMVLMHRKPSAYDSQGLQSFKLFSALSRQSSKNFKQNKFPDVYINTSLGDPIPYHMRHPVELKLNVSSDKEIYLSSKENEKSGIYIDNFLMFVINSAKGTKVFSVGKVKKHSYRGAEVIQVPPNSLHPGAVNITKYVPHNTAITMTVYALDYGYDAGMSDIYLIVR
ncbi:MAG: hypothetical protein CSA81_03645 [Acidobacteria bacterium]|nr:MAG: hypothetical protein CSA81_03645 [Acidobacteriota bacterium]PIE89861.1 MAG: hypothetical protein CR997_09305 [Acidobacteriota bacterium]